MRYGCAAGLSPIERIKMSCWLPFWTVDFNADGRSNWMQLGEIAESCGLEWGGRWKRMPDLPHLQNTYGLTLAEIKEICRAGHGIKAVWAELKAA